MSTLGPILGVFLMAQISDATIQRIWTKHIPDFQSGWHSQDIALRSEALFFVELLKTFPLVLLWIRSFLSYINNPVARTWVLAGSSLGFFLCYALLPSPAVRSMNYMAHLGFALGSYLSTTLFGRRIGFMYQNGYETTTTESCTGDSSAEQLWKKNLISELQTPAVFYPPGAILFYILGMAWLAACVCIAVVEWTISHLPEPPEDGSSPTTLVNMGCGVVGFAAGALCYVRLTRSLAWESFCAVTSAGLFSACLRLSSHDCTWQGRTIDAALTFPVMQIGLVLGFLTGPVRSASKSP